MVTVPKDSLQGPLRSLLEGGHDVVVLGLLGKLDGEVHHRDIGGGHTECHACKRPCFNGQLVRKDSNPDLISLAKGGTGRQGMPGKGGTKSHP